MKQFFKTAFLFCCLTTSGIYAQVGMNSNNPNPNAALDLNNTDGTNKKGLLLPKVALSSTDNFSPMTAHVAGMHIWNTATAGTGANAVTPGEYFNDGSKWVRISSDAWIQDGNNNGTMRAIGTNDNFDLPIETNGVEKMRVTSGGNVGIGTMTPNATLDIRPNPTSTTNPGNAFLGIGTTSFTAPSAGAGAIRYSTASGGSLEYSNGVVWNQLSSTTVRSIVVAKKTSTQNFSDNSKAIVVNWVEIVDNNNLFDPVTGSFTVPRDGQYSVSFSYDFIPASIASGSRVEAIITVNNVPDKKSSLSFPAAGNSEAGASISFVLSLKAGDVVNPMIFQTTGSIKTLRVSATPGASDDAFVNFSVAEL